MTTPPLVPSFGGQPPPHHHHQQQQQAQAARDVNTSSLCRIGQETVQDIVLRTMEIFQLLRNMQVWLALILPVTYSLLFVLFHFMYELLNGIKNLTLDKGILILYS